MLWCQVVGFEKDEKKLQTTEMKMLQIMCRKTLRDGISNQTICDMTDMAKIKEFMQKQRLSWYGHVEKMDDIKAKHFVVDSTKAYLTKDGKK